MHIAICDDDRNDLDILIQLVREYCASNAGQISVFSNAKELYHFTETNKVDIAILDIEMEAPNGYEIALQLINRQKPPMIIFVTNSMAYTTRGYGCDEGQSQPVHLCSGRMLPNHQNGRYLLLRNLQPRGGDPYCRQ